MKIAYIYLNNLNQKSANVNQTLNMVHALGKLTCVNFIMSWVPNKNLNCILDFFSINKNFGIKRMPVFLITKSFFLEKITRASYSFFVVLYLKFIEHDVIYTRDFGFLTFISYLPNWMKPKQTIFFETHTIYHKSSQQKVNYDQERRALKEADYFVPISKGVYEDLISLFGIAKNKITILTDGVNMDNFNKVKHIVDYLNNKYGINRENIVIVYAGSFKHWKGVDVLVKSVEFIKSNNFKILLIGGYGENRDRIDKLIQEKDINNRIVIDGFLSQKELINILKCSDVGVIPNTKTPISEKYTSPLKLFEYMTCGLPIICANLPSMKEILINEKNCLFFEAEDEKDLANKIDALLQNNNLRKKISTKNLQDVQEYTWDRRAEKIINIIFREKNVSR